MRKIKRFNLYRPEFTVECHPKFLGIPIAYLYWFAKCKKIMRFKFAFSKKHYYMLTIPKFESGVVDG